MAVREAVSVYNYLNKEFVLLPFSGAWHDAFENPEAYGAWCIAGLQGNGKTSFTMQLARYFEDLGLRVGYMSLEEYGSHTLVGPMKRAGWKEQGGRIELLKTMSPDKLDEWLGMGYKKPDVVIIDSVQYWVEMYQFSFKRYKDLKGNHSKRLFVFISHVKGNDPDGSVAVKIMRDASLKIFCQGYRAISKGRYIGKKGYYSIWPEKEKEIWLDK